MAQPASSQIKLPIDSNMHCCSKNACTMRLRLRIGTRPSRTPPMGEQSLPGELLGLWLNNFDHEWQMNDDKSALIDPRQLQIGMYVELELGWMAHPFPKGSFRISSDKQIEIIRGLGLPSVRFVPAKSDLPTIESTPGSDPVAPPVTSAVDDPAASQAKQLGRDRSELLGAQHRDLIACERRFGAAAREYKLVLEKINTNPTAATAQCLGLVNGFVGEMLGEGESAIRLLSEGMGDKASMHPVNVSIVALLLGKYLGLSEADMADLGVAAFLHDIGKFQLPDRVRWLEDNFTANEYKLYQEHVAQGVLLGKRMEVSAGTLQAIAQHHELVDGSGYPARVTGDRMSLPAKILSLVNRYDNLCNPSRPSASITPHEALSLIFAQLKSRFDPVVLGGFVRMMGVYPPGSVVQLTDERYALVVSVNSSRPLKPRVIVYDTRVPKNEALILDLEQNPALGIRRSLKPSGLPRAAMDYLSPRQRICYFFERSVDKVPVEVSP